MHMRYITRSYMCIMSDDEWHRKIILGTLASTRCKPTESSAHVTGARGWSHGPPCDPHKSNPFCSKARVDFQVDFLWVVQL